MGFGRHSALLRSSKPARPSKTISQSSLKPESKHSSLRLVLLVVVDKIYLWNRDYFTTGCSTSFLQNHLVLYVSFEFFGRQSNFGKNLTLFFHLVMDLCLFFLASFGFRVIVEGPTVSSTVESEHDLIEIDI